MNNLSGISFGDHSLPKDLSSLIFFHILEEEESPLQAFQVFNTLSRVCKAWNRFAAKIYLENPFKIHNVHCIKYFLSPYRHLFEKSEKQTLLFKNLWKDPRTDISSFSYPNKNKKNYKQNFFINSSTSQSLFYQEVGTKQAEQHFKLRRIDLLEKKILFKQPCYKKSDESILSIKASPQGFVVFLTEDQKSQHVNMLTTSQQCRRIFSRDILEKGTPQILFEGLKETVFHVEGKKLIGTEGMPKKKSEPLSWKLEFDSPIHFLRADHESSSLIVVTRDIRLYSFDSEAKTPFNCLMNWLLTPTEVTFYTQLKIDFLEVMGPNAVTVFKTPPFDIHCQTFYIPSVLKQSKEIFLNGVTVFSVEKSDSFLLCSTERSLTLYTLNPSPLFDMGILRIFNYAELQIFPFIKAYAFKNEMIIGISEKGSPLLLEPYYDRLQSLGMPFLETEAST